MANLKARPHEVSVQVGGDLPNCHVQEIAMGIMVLYLLLYASSPPRIGRAFSPPRNQAAVTASQAGFQLSWQTFAGTPPTL